MPTAKDLVDLKNLRENEQSVYDARSGRVNDDWMRDWKDRTENVDRMYRGDFSVEYPNQETVQSSPRTINIVQVGVDDISALAAETEPQLRSEPNGPELEEVEAAYLREQVASTYYLANDFNTLWVPRFAIDLSMTGAVFNAVTIHPGWDYPRYTRLDPRGSYPRIVNGELIDLLQVTRVSRRDAEAMFQVDLDEVFGREVARRDFEVEVLDFYDKRKVTRALTAVDAAGAVLAVAGLEAHTWEHNLGRPPVGWATLPSGDGAIRGLFDQVVPIATALNRIFNLQLDYADQMVYAPFFAYDVENDEDAPGPNTVYRGRSERSQMQRVAPAGNNPQLFALLEYLERQARAGAAYPAQRQGEVSQSIASAAFVSSTLGQLTTKVKHLQKHIAFALESSTEIAFELDRKFLDRQKPLLVPGKARFYVPSKDIGEKAKVRVVYGAGAGLDALNKRSVLQSDVSLGLTSKETAREQTDYLTNPAAEEMKIQKEQVEQALLQRLLTDPNVGIDTLMRTAALMNTGKTLMEAAEQQMAVEEAERREAALAQEEAAAAQGGGGGFGPPTGPAASPEEMAAGAQPGEAGAPGAPEEVSPMDMAQLMVGGRPS